MENHSQQHAARETVLICLAILSAMALIASNLLAIKVIDIMGAPFDAGIILYPITYAIGDLLVEFYGRYRANQIAIFSMLANVAAVIFLQIAVYLPSFAGAGDQSAFTTIFSAAPRVVNASLTAYVTSNFLNNYAFERIRQRPRSSFLIRALGSSFVAKVADVFIFEFMAFFMVLEPADLIRQMLAAYFSAVLLETMIFGVITQPVANKISKYLNDSDSAS